MPYKDKHSAAARASKLRSQRKLAATGYYKVWRENNVERARAYGRKHYYKTAKRKRFLQMLMRYGVSESELVSIAEQQQFRCKICNRAVPLKIDHDHVTGMFRGLICNDCNTLLGFAHDDVEILNNAVHYLENHKCQPK